ncbi:MAG: hypothetical protein NT016_01110 [Candidatus Aenigmarchaeota archaeon]|nr:hypothetical protein [Candidatus Aenigmarchaeota archaeon]
MPLEIEVKEVLDWYMENGIPLNKTKIYLSDRFENVRKEEGGVFFPRNLEGYVFPAPDEKEILARYVHESAHGSFLENFQIGQAVVNLDKEVYDLEKTLFDNEKIDNLIAIEKEQSDCVSRKLSELDIESLDSRFRNHAVYEVDKNCFEEYREKSSRLENIQTKLLPYMEGFSLLVEEKIIGQIKRTFSENYYLEDYDMLKTLEKEGFQNVIDYLRSLNVKSF